MGDWDIHRKKRPRVQGDKRIENIGRSLKDTRNTEKRCHIHVMSLLVN